MTLTLRIVNMTTLPDGGRVEYTIDQGRFELGRDTAMDWTLPDPNRFVSSCHCDIRWENGAYWLYDVSTNGTFVNGASMRVKNPYQLQNGDKLQIGHYLVEVVIGAAGAAAPGPAADPFGAPAGGAAYGGSAENPFGAAAPPSAGAFGGGDSFGGGGGDPFGAGAPGGDPFSTGSAGSDPFGADPFGSAPSSAPASDAFGGGGDPWAVPGVPGADSSAFDQNVPPPSAGDAGSDFIGMDFGAGAAPGAPAASPFGAAPSAEASPFGGAAQAAPSGDASPFGAAPAAPAPDGSPFGAAPSAPAPSGFGAAPGGAGEVGSPFGDPTQTTPPGMPPAPVPHPRQAPPSEGFGNAAPQATPPAATPPTPQPQPAAPRAGGGAADADILRAICEGAGLPPDALSGSDPRATAYEIGQSLRIVAAELSAVLKVRSKSKRLYEKSGRTEIGREDNNPLKFTPSPDQALQAMFGPTRPGFMRGPQTMQASFDDIKRHQFAIQAALQPALAKLIDDLRPEAIEDKVGGVRFGSKSAKAWELFVERWDAKTHPYENGMLDVFQAYFAEAYNKANSGN